MCNDQTQSRDSCNKSMKLLPFVHLMFRGGQCYRGSTPPRNTNCCASQGSTLRNTTRVVILWRCLSECYIGQGVERQSSFRWMQTMHCTFAALALCKNTLRPLAGASNSACRLCRHFMQGAETICALKDPWASA